jgi:hypothetical protein
MQRCVFRGVTYYEQFITTQHALDIHSWEMDGCACMTRNQRPPVMHNEGYVRRMHKDDTAIHHPSNCQILYRKNKSTRIRASSCILGIDGESRPLTDGVLSSTRTV